MIAELQGFALVFQTTHGLFLRSLEGLSDAETAERVGKQNSILWVAAHMVAVRHGFLKGFGGQADVPWAAQFPRGGRYEDVRDWPTLADVRARWDLVHSAFLGQLETMTNEQLAAETRIPGLDKTLLGAVGLAAMHDAYHIGQIGLLRRNYGLDRLVG